MKFKDFSTTVQTPRSDLHVYKSNNLVTWIWIYQIHHKILSQSYHCGGKNKIFPLLCFFLSNINKNRHTCTIFLVLFLRRFEVEWNLCIPYMQNRCFNRVLLKIDRPFHSKSFCCKVVLPLHKLNFAVSLQTTVGFKCTGKVLCRCIKQYAIKQLTIATSFPPNIRKGSLKNTSRYTAKWNFCPERFGR